MRIVHTLLLCLAATRMILPADLTPQLQKSFGRYIQLTEERQARDLNPERFLYSNPTAEQRAKIRSGEVLVVSRKTLDNGKEIAMPGGLVQDWVGLLFMPKATLAQVRAVLQDYPSYKLFYKPDVIDSKLLDHKASEYEIFLRLYKEQFVKIALNTTYHVKYTDLDANRMYVNSRSTRMTQAKSASKPEAGEFQPGHDDGFLWALNSYWRFEQADGGVYAQLEAVSLSRDLPFGLGWLKGFLQKFPVDSMQNTLKGTKQAVVAKAR